MISRKVGRRFDEQNFPLLYDICCLLEPVPLPERICQRSLDSWIFMAALSKIGTIETKEGASFIALMEPESDCVSDCRFSGAGSTIKPENTRNIRFRITRPLFNLVKNLNAGAVETLLRGIITSTAVCIGQAIQL